MTKKIVLLFLCITLAMLPPPTVTAHSGDTDANGGHYDSDTGEYHYHHGYPAHMHYDMDGDGYRDCPYDYDDKTGVNSGASSSSGSSTSSAKLSYSDGYADGYDEGYDAGYGSGYQAGAEEPQASLEEAKTAQAWASCFVVVLSILIIAMCVTIRSRNRQIKNLSALNKDNIQRWKQLKQEIDSIHKRHEADLDNKAKEYQSIISDHERSEAVFRSIVSEHEQSEAVLRRQIDSLESQLSTMSSIAQRYIIKDSQDQFVNLFERYGAAEIDIPEDIYFTNGLVPVRGDITEDKPYGDFTVYVARSGSCYHSNKYCGSGINYCRHAYDVIGKKIPCQRCRPDFPDTPPEWYLKIKEVQKK